MTKDEKVLDLKLKIIDLKLQKEGEGFKFALSVLVGFLTFFVTVDYIKDYFNSSLSSVVDSVTILQPQIQIILFLVILIVFPVGSGVIAMKLLQMLFKLHEKIYDERIKEVEYLIKDLKN